MEVTIEYKPTRQELERLVGLGMTDGEIAWTITRGNKTASWAKDRRIEHGVLRRKGGAAQVGGLTLDPVFKDDRERDHWLDRVRHGEVTLADVEEVTGSRQQDVEHEWRVWISVNHSRPLESLALRRARLALTNTSLPLYARMQALFGRRIQVVEVADRHDILLDGERVTLRQAVEATNEEARDLGLPTLTRED